MKKRTFECVWTTPSGEEVARWEFVQGGPVPEGFRWPPPDRQLIETFYMEGEFVYQVGIGPPIIPPLR